MNRLIFIALFSLFALTNCAKKEAEQKNKIKPPPVVTFINVQTENLELQQELAGRISPYLISEVRPQITGIVKERRFIEGSRVSQGQALYQIDPTLYNVNFKTNAASRAQALANLEGAKIKLARMEELIKINGVSKQEVDDARTAVKIFNANLALQDANLEGAKINLRYTNVLAPISGRIGKSNVTKGALVNANQTEALAIIQDISKVYVDITQSSNELLKLKKQFQIGALSQPSSANVKLILSDGTQYEQIGKIQFSDLTVDEKTGSVSLRALFDNYDGTLLPGMYVRAIISKGTQANAITIPQNSVLIDGSGNAYVYIVGEDGKSKKVAITLGEMIGDKWQINSGLKPNDKLIIAGMQKLKPNIEIKAKPLENINNSQKGP